jgi:hypothetical protein
MWRGAEGRQPDGPAHGVIARLLRVAYGPKGQGNGGAATPLWPLPASQATHRPRKLVTYLAKNGDRRLGLLVDDDYHIARRPI